MAIRGQVSKCTTETVLDPTGLGKWNYIDLSNGDRRVRIISAYQSVKSVSTLGTMQSQRLRYFIARGINVCPRKIFITHLTQFISNSMAVGLEVILTIDSNEHLVKGRLAKQLQHLGLAEAYCTKFDSDGGPASFFRGKHQIDGIWYTRNVIPTAVSFCPFHFGVGDHRMYTVDFQLTSVLGELSVPLHVINKRRLICTNKIVVNRYLERAEKQLTLHNIPQKIQ